MKHLYGSITLFIYFLIGNHTCANLPSYSMEPIKSKHK